jgi:hypothetical protein
MWMKQRPSEPPTLEAIRKKASLLIIDDQAFPYERLFTRDGYHIQRWPKVQNLSQLTDDHFDLILLDLHGVGLQESPERQGLGILEHIKTQNPTQLVIAYSAQTWNVANRDYFALADEVLDKNRAEYVDFKKTVDVLLMRRATVGYFIAKMNGALGDQAALAPKAVPKAVRAFRSGNTEGLRRYLTDKLPDAKQVSQVVSIVGIGVKVFRMIHSGV